MSGAQSIINGKLSTPRSGVGTCDNGNVIALDGDAPDVKGMVKLPQAVKMNTPARNPPGAAADGHRFQEDGRMPRGCAGRVHVGGDVITITPVGQTPVQLGNVSMLAQAEVHLKAGIYEVNSMQIAGNAKVSIDSGPVVFRVNGKDASGADLATPIDHQRRRLVNGAKVPKNLQFVYGGTGEVQINGGASTSFLTYAPNATVQINGGGDLYGAVVGAKVMDNGGATHPLRSAIGGMGLHRGQPHDDLVHLEQHPTRAAPFGPGRRLGADRAGASRR